tara:strand:+ start:378 stop:533 length:156 start_codon:yes stop_codon:yes gene_type:complete
MSETTQTTQHFFEVLLLLLCDDDCCYYDRRIGIEKEVVYLWRIFGVSLIFI